MKTFTEFLDWCRKNPTVEFYSLDLDLYVATLNWRIAIAKNTYPMIQDLRTPADVRAILKLAISALGDNLTNNIQRTFDEL